MTTCARTVRFLGISGSIRTGSYSTAILRALQAHLAPDIELRVLTLETVPLYNEDQDRQPALPAVAALRNSVGTSEAVLIASPEFNHGVPGILKNALDWASRPVFASCFRGKPVLILSSSTAFTGGVRAQYQLRETLASMQAEVVPTREIIIPSVDRKMSNGHFDDKVSLAFITAAVNEVRQRALSKRESVLQ